MKYLIRKISRAKWEQKPNLPPNSIAADAVTSDLRTNGNKLSLWICTAESDDELNEIVLALASTGDRPDKIDIAWFDSQLLDNDKISIKTSKGETPILDLRERHVDAIRLDLKNLARVAEYIKDAVRNKNQFRRLSRNQTIDLIKDAILAKRLHLEDLSEHLRSEVQKAINKSQIETTS